jgi:hypothetical protein
LVLQITNTTLLTSPFPATFPTSYVRHGSPRRKNSTSSALSACSSDLESITYSDILHMKLKARFDFFVF